MRVSLKILFLLASSLLISGAMESCLKESMSTASDEKEVSAADSSEILIAAPRNADTYLLFENAEAALRYMRKSKHREKYERGILPQMALDELEYAKKLLNNSHDGFIVVDKERMKVILFNRYGEEAKSYGMACAKNFGTKHNRSDSRTPEGFFSVKKIHNSTEWYFVDDNGVKSNKKGEFGPRFIRLNIPGTNQIGIHGTSAPWSIGGRRSHGCIRIENDNILELVNLVDSGMPVIITPGRRDMVVNMEEGYNIPSISTVPGRSSLALPSKPLRGKGTESSGTAVSKLPDSIKTEAGIHNKSIDSKAIIDSVAIEEDSVENIKF